MSEIDEYALILFFRFYRTGLDLTETYMRYGEIVKQIEDRLISAIEPAGGLRKINTKIVSEEILVSLANCDAIIEKKDKFAGLYYKFLRKKYDKACLQILNDSPISQSASDIGERFFPDVFAGYLDISSSNEEMEYSLDLGQIPAADRIVKLSDNQISAVAAPLSDLIEKIDLHNGLSDAPGVRERLLGQMRAGRELIKSGEIRAYVLYVTLLRGLSEVANRYKGHAIGGAAIHLLELLIDQVLGVGN